MLIFRHLFTPPQLLKMVKEGVLFCAFLNIVSNKDNPESDYSTYYAAMYTGTNQRTARVTRGSIFKKYILE